MTTKNKRVSLTAMLAALETVTDANDKNVSVSAAPLKDSKADLTGTIVPTEEVSATDKGVKTTEPGPANGGGDGKAVTADVGKVKANLPKADAGNTAEVDAVTNKTADAVKAGEKDLTTGISTENIETNEAEHISPAVTDEMVMDVEHAATVLDDSGITERTDRVLDEADAVAEDLGKIETVAAALEKYSVLLTGMHKRGKMVDRDTAGAIKIALESYDRNEFARTVPSLEAFDRRSSQLTVSIELLDNVKGKIKAVGAAAKEALKKLLALLIDLWDHFSTDINTVRDRLQTLKSKSPGTGTLKLSNTARLSINGVFVGTSPEVVKNLREVAKEVVYAWPSRLKHVVEYSLSQDYLKIYDVCEKLIGDTFRSFTEVRGSDIPGELSDYPTVTSSPALPGDRAMYIGISKKATGDELYDVSKASEVFKFVFGNAPAAGGKADDEVKVPSEQEFQAMVGHLIEVCNAVDARKDAQNQLRSLLKEIETKHASDSVAIGAAKASLIQQKAFMGYLLGTVKAYLAFLEHVAAGQPAEAE